MEDYERKRLWARLRLVLWLLQQADSQGKSHGEKHHFHKVMEFAIADIISEFTGRGMIDTRGVELDEPNDIPF